MLEALQALGALIAGMFLSLIPPALILLLALALCGGLNAWEKHLNKHQKN
jgi:hypothetical protein